MKIALRRLGAAMSVGLLSGCISSHPLPEDVADTTLMIVKKARCEARDAVVAAFADYLDEKKGSEQRFASLLRNEPHAAASIEGKLSPETLLFLDRYKRGAIGYDFKLNIQTTRGNSASFNILSYFTNGNVSTGVGGGLTNQNQATREFQVADRISDLMRLYGSQYCNDRTPRKFAYPITGRIGIEESVKTFAKLDREALFQAVEGATRYTDELTFTTTLDANLDPTITVNGIDKRGEFGVSPTTLRSNYQRIDQHRVTIAIRVPLKDEPEKKVDPSTGSRQKSSPRAQPARPLLDPLRGVLRDLDEKRRLDLIQPLGDYQNRL